ncbi:MAG: hypothetical protein COB01_00565 [Lutibacter sp.]|nr:MAG: hypothetical protein COB01_00565 [Lutibacter sp.]
METYKHCQSCGMPLCKDPKGSGTDHKGQQSNKYCSYCYEDGKFLQPDITAEEMQMFVKGKLKEMGGFMKLFAGFYSKGIPKLERWKNK